jgi:hypothetical protein
MMGIERRGRTGAVVLLLVGVAALLVALQYTPYAPFSAEKTSMLWGILVGLIIGGFIFGWLRFKDETSQ